MIRRLLYTALTTLLLAGCSSDSGDTPAASSAPTPPSDVAAERIAETKVRVTWSDRSDSESGFTVWVRAEGETAPRKIGFTARNVESYTVDGGLEQDKTYTFGVCADAFGAQIWAANASARTRCGHDLGLGRCVRPPLLSASTQMDACG